MDKLEERDLVRLIFTVACIFRFGDARDITDAANALTESYFRRKNENH